MELLSAHIGRGTRNMIQNIAKHSSFKHLLDTSFKNSYLDTTCNLSDKQGFPAWGEHFSLIAIAVIMECARILSVSPGELKAHFDQEMAENVKSQTVFARNFLEYSFFHAISVSMQSRNYLNDKSFRKWTFDMFLAWEFPSSEDLSNSETSFHCDSVCVEAYARLSPLMHITADCITVYDQFELLTSDTCGRLTFRVYDRFLTELSKMFRIMLSHSSSSSSSLSSTLGIIQKEENIIEVEENATEPVLQHVGATSWPGRLTLTDRALYFEPSGFVNHDSDKHYQVRSKPRPDNPSSNESEDKSDDDVDTIESFIESIILDSSPISCAGCHVSYIRDDSNPLSKAKLVSTLKKPMHSKIFNPILLIFPSEPLSVPLPNLPHWRVKPKSRLAWKQTFESRTKMQPTSEPVFDPVSKTVGTFFSFGGSVKPEPLVLEFSEPNARTKRDFWLLAIREMSAAHSFLRSENCILSERMVHVLHRSMYGIMRMKAMMNMKHDTSINSYEGLLTFLCLKFVYDDNESIIQHMVMSDHPFLKKTSSNTSENDVKTHPLSSRFKSKSEGGKEEGLMPSMGSNKEGSMHYAKTVDDLFVRAEPFGTINSSEFESVGSDQTSDSSHVNERKESKNERLWMMMMMNAHCFTVGEFSSTELMIIKIRKEKKKERKNERKVKEIDHEIIEKIGNNLTLFKELCILFFMLCQCMHGLVLWEEPIKTILFMLFVTYLTYRNWLYYALPTVLLLNVIFIMYLRFGHFSNFLLLDKRRTEITILTSPEPNIIQKLAIWNQICQNVQSSIRFLNVFLLKLQALLFSESIPASNDVALVFLVTACLLAILPFRVVFLLFFWDSFTRGMSCRREETQRLCQNLKEWWLGIPVMKVRFAH